MVGFVLIMVLVAVVFLIFLGITLRRDVGAIRSESSEVYQFLESSMQYTTSCNFRSSLNFLKLGELFEECFSGNNCLNGEDSCDVLNQTLSNILKSSWNIGPESSVKGYEFISFYVTNASSQGEEIISLKEGECTSSIKGASYLTPAFPGKIENSLVICS